MLQAQFIDSQQQAGNSWLIQLESAQALSWPIGTQFRVQDQQAWLFQAPQKSGQHRFNLLSDKAWLYQPHQQLDLQIITEKQRSEPNWQTNQLWLASDLAIAAVFDAAKRWQQSQAPKGQFIALLHTHSDSFPFRVKPARFLLPLNNSAANAIGAAPLLEDWKIPNRLASSTGIVGCYEGSLEELYQAWLSANLNPLEGFEINWV